MNHVFSLTKKCALFFLVYSFFIVFSTHPMELLFINPSTCKVSTGLHNNTICVHDKTHNAYMQVSYTTKRSDSCSESEVYCSREAGGFIQGASHYTVEKRADGKSMIILIDPSATINTQRIKLLVNDHDEITIEKPKLTRHKALASRILVRNSITDHPDQKPVTMAKFKYLVKEDQ